MKFVYANFRLAIETSPGEPQDINLKELTDVDAQVAFVQSGPIL